jgi:WD40 repeat protein/energy-coupling factor transporter ATP-binding protein EcfA2
VADDTYDVFVSYSRADGRHAKEIDSVLRDKGLKTFFDRSNLAGGQPWVRALEQAIGAARAVIVLIGPRGLGNTQQYERELAFVRQTRDSAFPVVPVILPETTTDPPFDFLRVLTWVDFSHVTRVSDAPDVLEQLLTAIHGGKTPAEGARDAICPYRGLDAFREEDSAFFFGRGSADDPNSPIGELVSKVREHPFVMVVGRSGSGKSSLVYAGLLPALRRERDRFWDVLSLRPGPEPLRALAAAFNPRSEDEGAAEYAKRITKEADELRTGDPELLSHMIREKLGRAEGEPDRLLLYIDQWEELYAQAPSGNDKERATQHADVSRFIDLLLTAARTAPVAVVATVRADFYDPLIGHQEIKSLLPTRQVLLGKMLRSELESTIVEPARKVGLTFDPPNLVQRILDEAGEDEGMLPLLQYALKESWALRKGNTITGDSYARSGGVREAIRITAERAFEALSAKDQQAARQLFLRLVTPGEGQEDTRARAAMPSEPMQRRIVEQFAGPRTRLLVTGSDHAARPMVEVAHEALIRTWPRLRGWIDANREKLRARAAVLQAKAEWEQQGRREDLLLPTGFQLERARTLLAEPGDIPTDEIKEFILLSSAREESELKARENAVARERQQLEAMAAAVAKAEAEQNARARFQRRSAWALAAVALLALAGLVGVVWQSRFTFEREARVFASLAADAIHQEQYDRAVRYAVAGLPPAGALPIAPWSDELEARLAGAAHAIRLGPVLKVAGSKILGAAFSPNGAWVVTGAHDGIARIWNADTGAQIRRLEGHQGSVGICNLAFTSDGSRVATYDETAVRIWNANTGAEIRRLEGEKGGVSYCAFSPDGRRVITVSLAGTTASVWDADTGAQIAVLTGLGGNEGRALATFSHDGMRVLTASSNATVRIWDARTWSAVVLKGHERTILTAAFAADGMRVVTTSRDMTARVWNAVTGDIIAVLRGHEGPVWQATFSPDRAQVVTASGDNTVRLWEAETGTLIATLKGHENRVCCAIFSPDGTLIASSAWDQTARIWDAKTRAEVAVLKGHGGWVTSATFSQDGSRLLTTSTDNTARLWKTKIGSDTVVLKEHHGPLRWSAFSPDGGRLLTVANKGARLWDVKTGMLLGVVEPDAPVVDAKFSEDGEQLLTLSDGKPAVLSRTQTGESITVLGGHEEHMVSATFNHEGTRVVTAERDKIARLWDAKTGAELGSLKGHEGSVLEAVFSPDGKRVATISSDKTVRLWDAETRVQLALVGGNGVMVTNLAFSPDGERLVTISFDEGRIWNSRTGAAIAVLAGHSHAINDVDFSPDGERIVTASSDTTARLWNGRTGTELSLLKGHRGEVWSASFSPDGARIVTISDDATAHVWDAKTGAEMAVLRGHTDVLTGAVFSRDATQIMTASRDKTIRTWDVAWATKIRGTDLRDRVCQEKLVNEAAQGFSEEELRDPILRGRQELRNPCARRGPLSPQYWTRLWSAPATVDGLHVGN